MLSNLIGSMMDKNESVTSSARRGFRHLIGNGHRSEFWADNWTGRADLKSLFPRIFALVVVKQGPFSQFGHWEGGWWRWDVQLRRRPLDCELEVWEEFLNILESSFLDEYGQDKLIWSPSPIGHYSCKSFRVLLQDQVPATPIWKALWCIPVPLKLRTFMWLLLKYRLPFRERLARIHLIPSSQNICTLCDNSEETFFYFFLHCNSISALWYKVAGMWNVSLAYPESFLSFFPYVVLHMSFRLKYYLKWLGMVAFPLFLMFCRSPASVLLALNQSVPRTNVSLSPPDRFSLKINVGKSFSLVSSGIAGVFRNHLGALLLHFAKHVETDSVIHAEVLAIHEEFLIAVASRWSNSIHF